MNVNLDGYSFPMLGVEGQVLRVVSGNLAFSSVTASLNDGTMDNTIIGGNTAVSGNFSSLRSLTTFVGNVVSASNLTVGNYNFPISAGSNGEVLTLVNGNLAFGTVSSSSVTSLSNTTMDNTTFGLTTPASGNFTTITSTGSANCSSKYIDCKLNC